MNSKNKNINVYNTNSTELKKRSNDFLKNKLQCFLKNTAMIELHQAMQYSLIENGGSRWRPLLVYYTAAALNTDLTKADDAAAATECIHAYSLVHDDLPAMDDDDFRRQKPSCHRAYNESTAILAGDCLSNMAFEILSSEDNSNPATLSNKQRLELTKTLAQAAGARGMAYGQALDLAATNNHQQNQSVPAEINIKNIENIHYYKTGCLFAAAMKMAAISCNIICAEKLDQFYQLGMNIGMCYQLQDDIDDAETDICSINLATASDKVFINKKINHYRQQINNLTQQLIPSENLAQLNSLLNNMLKINFTSQPLASHE
jgi:geranylgeranyl pyrophosphate synthase